MEGQLHCLAVSKSECLRKDGMSWPVATLAQHLSQSSTAAMLEVRRRLCCLERDISVKKEQILILQDRVRDDMTSHDTI